jgi:hypothetical protein
MPLEIVRPSSNGVARPSASSRYSEPTGVVPATCIDPAQKRPVASHLPSFILHPGLTYLDWRNHLERPAVIEHAEPVPHRRDEYAVHAWRHAADRLADRLGLERPGGGGSKRCTSSAESST